jgi:hypothetical protein
MRYRGCAILSVSGQPGHALLQQGWPWEPLAYPHGLGALPIRVRWRHLRSDLAAGPTGQGGSALEPLADLQGHTG